VDSPVAIIFLTVKMIRASDMFQGQTSPSSCRSADKSGWKSRMVEHLAPVGASQAVQVAILLQRIEPPWSVAMYHQGFVIDFWVLVGLLSLEQNINYLKNLVTHSHNRSLVSPSDHKAFVEPLELALGLSCTVGRFAQERPNVSVGFAGTAALSFPGALLVARTHPRPGTKAILAAEPAHVHTNFGKQHRGTQNIKTRNGLQNGVGVCLSCHKDVPSGRLVYRIISTIGSRLGMIPKTDPEHQKLIGWAMFVAANIETFGTLAAGIIVLIVVILLVRRKKARKVRK
jgi:hypothetical protein